MSRLTATFVVALLVLAAHAANAQDRSALDARRTTIALRAENDVVSGSDDNYTNGVSLTVSREGRGLVGGIWRWLGVGHDRLISSYEFGQIIVTPADIRRAVPDPHDRPYAGMLYVALSTQAVRDNRFHGLKVITGIVGPSSLAEQTQRAFHKWIGSPTPAGWKYQLRNEPILNVVYEHRRRYTYLDSERGWSGDVVPMVGGMLGNVLIQAEADTQFRFGYNVPQDFGSTLMRGLGNLPFPLSAHDRTRHRFGIYAFVGGGANLVARNLTLDGNTFHDSPRVSKKSAFAAGEAGVAVWTHRFRVTFTYVNWGREYDAQPADSRYGALTLAYHF